MAEEKRLIGSDGQLGTCSIGVSGTTIAAKTWAKITGVKTSASQFGSGLTVGDFYYNPTSSTITLSGGDTASPVTFTSMLDVSGWSLNINADEVETTVMADKYKKYRVGKLDADGTVKFVFIRGISDLANGIANQFFDIATIANTGVVTFSSKVTTPLYLLGYMDANTSTTGEIFNATLMNVQFFNFSLPMNMSEAVTLEPKFRLVGDADPVLYRITNA